MFWENDREKESASKAGLRISAKVIYVKYFLIFISLKEGKGAELLFPLFFPV
jgi:hypothetical protein